MSKCLIESPDEGGECKISSGSVQKMDPVEQTAGRLGFRKNRRARLAVGSKCRGTEQVIRQVTG